MEELDRLNKEECRRYGKTGRRSPRTASSAMCTFMIINVSSLQLIPLNMIAYRAKYGSAGSGCYYRPGHTGYSSEYGGGGGVL